jgi:hypothetical protein
LLLQYLSDRLQTSKEAARPAVSTVYKRLNWR